MITGNNLMYAIYKKYYTLYQQYIFQYNFHNITVRYRAHKSGFVSLNSGFQLQNSDTNQNNNRVCYHWSYPQQYYSRASATFCSESGKYCTRPLVQQYRWEAHIMLEAGRKNTFLKFRQSIMRQWNRYKPVIRKLEIHNNSS